MSIGQTVVQNETSSQLWLNILGIWVATFLYGVFCVLFGRCVSILINRMRQLERQGILLGATILLFALSSGQIVVLTINAAIMVGQSDLNPDQMLNASVLIYVSSCLCSDALLIYRCYVIWHESFYVVAAPLLLLVTATGFGYVQNLTYFRILSLITVFSVTFLIVLRIIWAARQRRTEISPLLRHKYAIACSTILESGVLYTVFVSVHFALFSVGSPIAPIMFSAVSQIVGIAPTLIFVRVGVEAKPASSVSTNV
ncbi:hypothetical protein DFH08DRAFT_296596 [Mycena albidolilacea]|uniref:Uncharacterized protein n=1 Tax=Mycena albidolilacea TaxID=1033008 RepID=A0AAD7EK45_9AGAR|nr:hypothetical protein DFH08DRAFT_296596 [Mycena albidolilacea]